MKKVLGSIILIILLAIALDINAKNEIEKTNNQLSYCFEQGVCNEIDVKNNLILVHEYNWSKLEHKDKIKMAKFFLKYIRIRNSQTKTVYIEAANSTRNLAAYNVAVGYTEN